MHTRATTLQQVHSTRRIPGEVGIWIFLLSDMLMFALLFVLFTLDQAADRQGFLESQDKLDENLGLINTVLLVTSSWFVVLGVDCARKQMWRRASGFIAMGMLSGCGFLVVKSVEYTHLIQQGYSLISDKFFSYYFIVTGIHFFHVLIGLVVLGFLWRGARGAAEPKNYRALESGTCYWHMVDLLWIAIFPLLYLVR